MDLVASRRYKNASLVVLVLFVFCVASRFLPQEQQTVSTITNREAALVNARLATVGGVIDFGPSGEIPVDYAKPIPTFSNIHVTSYKNSLPNPYVTSSENVTAYQQSILTFLHNPKSGGTTLKFCLQKLSRFLGKDNPLLVTPVSREATQTGFMNGVIKPEDHDIMMGGASLGVCESFSSRRCSYFTIVREPYDRMISHYFFCKEGGESSISCDNKTIEEFAIDAGSIFFAQLALTVDCRCENNCNDLSKQPWHCSNDYKTYYANAEHKEEMLQYLVQQLDKYFAVIGLTEEYEVTLNLLQHTFGLPFHDRCHETRQNAGSYGTQDKRELDEKKREALRAMLASQRVKEILHPDVVLYERAKEIYNIQKTKLFST